MASTIEHPPADQAPSDRHWNQHRAVYVVTAILAISTIVLAAIITFDNNDSGAGASMPAEVEQVLDEFQRASENMDFEAYATLVTDQFRRPEYMGDPEGLNPARLVRGLDDYEILLSDNYPQYEVDRIGDPIVVGEGPWYVSYAETWKWPEQDLQYESIYTYVLVEQDGEILIDDGYWAGHSVPLGS